MRKVQDLLRLLVFLLPHSFIKRTALRVLGVRVGRTAVIGPTLVWRVGEFRVADGCRIGPFNVIRNLRSFIMEEHSVLGQWNWISAAPSLTTPSTGGFSIGAHSALTSRHYVDCSGGFDIGNFSTVAGVRSTFITHGISWKLSAQTTRAIVIGDFVLIGSNASVVPGTHIGDRVVVGMGTVLRGSIPQETLVVGQEGRVVKRAITGKYFAREVGYVD